MKLYYFTFIILVLTFTSCSIFGSESNQSKIVGQWEWIRSSGGITGQTTTPDSTGESTRQLNFNSDYTFSFFRADTLVKTGKYSLREVEGDVIISYDTGNDNLFFDQRVKISDNGDTLVLSDECYDCYINTYIRK